MAGQAHYSATKGYVQNLAEGLATEFRPLGIDILSSAPGPVRTKFANRAGLTFSQEEDPSLIARDTIAALGKKATVIPGRLGKVLSYALATAPRSLRVKIMSSIAQGMLTKR